MHETHTGILYPDMVTQEAEAGVQKAKQQAAALKAAIAKLSKMELVVGAKYIAEVSRLIQAVEAL